MHNEFGKDDKILMFCSRLDRLEIGSWRLVRMMDMHGKNTGATLLVRFFLTDV